MAAPTAFRSPLTGDVWGDARPAVGTLGSLATYLNERRPRRRPPPEIDGAISQAASAAGIFAGLPKISSTGIEGTQASDAYWKAKDARFVLNQYIGDNYRHNWRYWSRGTSDEEREGYLALVHDPDNRFSSVQQTAIRLGYLTALMTEKASSGHREVIEDVIQPAITGAVVLLEPCNIDREEAASIERVWQFTCAAGRTPTEADTELLAAFEAALMADQPDFARHLAKHGYGVGTR